MYLREFKSIWTFVTVYLLTLGWTSMSLAAFAVTTTVLQPNLTGTNLAILRQPDANPNSHIGIFIMHPDAGYSTFSACTGLAQRGFTTLCADTVFNNRAFEFKGYEDHAPAITAGINYLRTQVPGITKVLIFGHSMGAPMMAYYENVAEHGSAVCTGPEKIIACDTTNLTNPNGTNKLVPVDGIILFDAHLGDALATFTMSTRQSGTTISQRIGLQHWTCSRPPTVIRETQPQAALPLGAPLTATISRIDFSGSRQAETEICFRRP